MDSNNENLHGPRRLVAMVKSAFGFGAAKLKILFDPLLQKLKEPKVKKYISITFVVAFVVGGASTYFYQKSLRLNAYLDRNSEMASFCMERRMYQEAIPFWNRVLDKTDLFTRDIFIQKMRCYDEALEKFSEEPASLKGISIDLFKTEKQEFEKRVVDRVINKLNLNIPDTLTSYLKGRGDLDRLESIYKTALDKHPKKDEFRLKFIRFLLDHRKIDQALSLYPGLKKREDKIQAIKWFAQAKQAKKATELFFEIIKDGKVEEIRPFFTFLDENKLQKEKGHYYEELIKNPKGDLQIYQDYIQYLSSRKEFGRAIEVCEVAKQRWPKNTYLPDLYLHLQVDSGNFKKVAEILGEKLKARPFDHSLRLTWIQALLGAQEYELVASEVKAQLKFRPVKDYLRRGFVFKSRNWFQRLFDKIWAWIKRILTFYKKSGPTVIEPSPIQWMDLLTQGVYAEEKLKRPDVASNYVLWLLEHNPQNADMFYQIGDKVGQGGTYGRGLEWMRRGLALDKNQQRYNQGAGDLAFSVKRSSEAIKLWRENADPKKPDTYIELAKYIEGKGLRKEALAVLNGYFQSQSYFKNDSDTSEKILNALWEIRKEQDDVSQYEFFNSYLAKINDFWIYDRTANFLQDRGDDEGAESLRIKGANLLKNDEKKRQLYRTWVQRLLNENRLEEAIPKIQELLSKFPDYRRADRRLLIRTYLDLKQDNQAFENALILLRENIDEENERLKEGGLLNEVLVLFPRDRSVSSEQAGRMWGILQSPLYLKTLEVPSFEVISFFLDRGLQDAALTLANRYLEKQHSYSSAKNLYDIFVRANAAQVGARFLTEMLDEEILTHPRSFELYETRAGISLLQGDQTSAIESLKECVRRNRGQPEILLKAALFCESRNLIPQAMDFIIEASNLDPHDQELKVVQARLAILQGNGEQVRKAVFEYADSLLEDDLGSQAVDRMLSLITDMWAKTRDAARQETTAWLIDRNDKNKKDPRFAYTLAVLSMKQKDFGQARKYLDDSLNRAPGYLPNYKLLLDLPDTKTEERIHWLNNAVQLQPEDTAVTEGYALYFVEAKKYRRALSYFDQISDVQKSKELSNVLLSIYGRLGYKKSAIALLDSLSRQFPLERSVWIAKKNKIFLSLTRKEKRALIQELYHSGNETVVEESPSDRVTEATSSQEESESVSETSNEETTSGEGNQNNHEGESYEGGEGSEGE